jgi:DNA-binding NarL/FixJ family response regulator
MGLQVHIGSTLAFERTPRRHEREPMRLSRSLPVLTPRQFDVARVLADFRSNKEIAATLGISLERVKQITHGMYARVGVRDRIEFIRWFQRRFSVSPITAAPEGPEQSEIRIGAFE